MNFDLQRDALSRTLIAAHRGVTGGNIPGNTLAAFEGALLQGADLIELDVSNSIDGELFVFHPGMEHVFLGMPDKLLSDLPAAEIRKLRFLNSDATPTQFAINTFDEALEYLKGRCYINVDKFWNNVDPIVKAIRRHNMMDQILVKTRPNEEVYRYLEENAPDVNYMAILSGHDDQSEQLLKRGLHYAGAEVLFDTEASDLASEAYVERMHKAGLLVWVNAIVYNYKTVLTAGHNDDISIMGRMDEGWGWLLDKGYDILQTDWPMMLKQYISQRNAR